MAYLATTEVIAKTIEYVNRVYEDHLNLLKLIANRLPGLSSEERRLLLDLVNSRKGDIEAMKKVLDNLDY